MINERILGYTDRLSAAPGDSIAFKVSAPLPGKYDARLVRLICGDDSPEGPGLKVEDVASEFAGSHKARQQPMQPGSFVWVTARHPFELANFTLQVMIWPTLPGNGKAQGILGNFDAATGSGYALYLDEDGCLAFRAGGNAPVSTGVKLLARHWYEVHASFDSGTGRVILGHKAMLPYHGQANTVSHTGAVPAPSGEGGRFLIAAWNDGKAAAAHFNGKIDSPRVSARALQPEQVARLRGLPLDVELAPYVVAAWDFSRGIGTVKVTDVSGNRHHGRTINLPTRAMTGWNWDGSEFNWQKKPAHYGAIHFHDDDLYDCGWRTDFTFTVPDGMKSGIYCAHVSQKSADGSLTEDYIPFFVRPRRGTATAPLALLIPTASYLAYANHQMPSSWWFEELSSCKFTTLNEYDRYLEEHECFGLSVYDDHTDGSGVCHSSFLRPILNMRPKTDLWQFNADTHLTDWLEKKGIPYDVITDDDLHAEGIECLRPYRCVMTGTHPEYYSKQMLDALQSYTNGGGRLMYMGANGFYWRIAYHPGLPGVIEHRRSEDGMRAWFSEVGEYHMSFTGELSGLWARNGRPPNMLVGNAFAAQGFINAVPYHRTPDSRDPRVAFMFEGLGDEPIGDFGIVGGGAAGWEIDRADTRLGTPPHALMVATATDFPDSYHWVNEEMNHTHSAVNGDTCPRVRCDMMFFETLNGGAVFSTGSISYAGSLSHNNYDNNVSRLTENVIRRFIDPAAF
ncbi:N,N-dimethylformamidase [Dongia mobilis]|uniref:N,N-dimethylformamidase n=1 Tax=Dongia mobilis TaxID=578943 RepID=A0A4R6WTG3_9PROT|nr:N,N-dimethylformamidase beta subunit family domain-containing protein [Dongia mobilis]TDQ83328.1 N,N-dimethylformamidase [Dongia mobilis]